MPVSPGLLIIIDRGFKAGLGFFGGLIQLHSQTLVSWAGWLRPVAHSEIAEAATILQGLLHFSKLNLANTCLWIGSSTIISVLHQQNFQAIWGTILLACHRLAILSIVTFAKLNRNKVAHAPRLAKLGYRYKCYHVWWNSHPFGVKNIIWCFCPKK